MKLAEDLKKAQEEEAAKQAALAEKRKCVLGNVSCSAECMGLEAQHL